MAHTSAALLYVNMTSAHPAPPFNEWSTAARTIQDAVDSAAAGDQNVVTNGIYAIGGRAVDGTMTNRVTVDKPLTLRSVNGPQFTVIEGHPLPSTTHGEGAVRCAYLTSGATLSGFTLTKGATSNPEDWWGREGSGGGVFCTSPTAVVTNCLMVGNSAATYGGGAADGTLYDCTLINNSAYYGGGAVSLLNNCRLASNVALSGGGAWNSTLNNCVLNVNSAVWDGGGAYWCELKYCALVGNIADLGGGAYESIHNNCSFSGNSANYGGATAYGELFNCVLTGNSASNAGGGAWLGRLDNCTLTGNSAGYSTGWASGTINNCIIYYNTARSAPNFSEATLNFCCTTPLPSSGLGNIDSEPQLADLTHLSAASPCINAGGNVYAPSPTDLEGLPRIVSGTVDIGAHEFQGAGSVISYAWLQHYGVPADGSVDTSDQDRDGHNTWQEWRCHTDPTNALSVLRMLSPDRTSGTNLTVRWQSEEGVTYFLERSVELSAAQPFTLLATQLIGAPSFTTFTDTNASESLQYFYRTGVHQP